MGLKQSGPSFESQDGLEELAELEEEEEGKVKERTFTQQVEKLSDHLPPQFPSRSTKESSHWQKPGIGAEEGTELTASY